MKLEQVLQELQNYKLGTYIKIQYKSAVAILKEYQDIELTKVVSTVARLGCDYGAVVKDWTPSETRKPWYHNLFKNLVIEHNSQPKQYLRILTTKNSSQTKVQWYLNGAAVDYNQIKHMIKQSEKSELTVYFKNIEDIIQLGKAV